jgi:protein-S-isoprenylcysteine O-methyltransferase Ste14
MTFNLVFEIGIWNAWIFMSIFIIQMFTMFIAGKYIWEKSQVPIQAKRNYYEKYVGSIANFFWLIALIYSIFLPLKLDTIWFFIGLIIYILGVIILIKATYDFIKQKPNQIIKTGIYKYSRHPLYLSTFFILIGTGIATLSWLFLILNIIIIYFFYKESLIEERHLIKIFNDDYKEYMLHVSPWIGRRK